MLYVLTRTKTGNTGRIEFRNGIRSIIQKEVLMISKYYGFCVACKNKIMPGDDIKKNVETGKWNLHTDCQASKAEHKSVFIDRLHNKTDVSTVDLGSAIAEVESRSYVEDTGQSFTGKTDFIPSHFQEAIYDFIKLPYQIALDLYGTANAIIEAVAGSGKTTTIVKALELTQVNSKVAFLAFNKHIATELKRRCPEHVHVSTLHSLGYALLRACYGNIEVNEDKTGLIMESIWPVSRYRKAFGCTTDLLVNNQRVEIPNSERTANRQKRSVARKIVALIKATLTDETNPIALYEMCEQYGIDANGDMPEILNKMPDIIEACKDTTVIDYDDMIWLPVVNKRLALNTEKFDWLFVDEAQDLNKCQIAFLMNSVRTDGRIIAVGDRRQSLYGFRGADVLAIPRLIEMLKAKVLPLSISYRCPRAVVERAKTIVPQIEASDTAIQGEIIPIEYKDFLLEVQPGDMVVCRTNAPLVRPAFECIRSHKKAIIRGKDIGKSLVIYIERFQATDLGTLEVLMRESTMKEIGRLLDQGKELAAEMAKDKLDTISTVSNECATVEELVQKLETLFDDANTGVVFSSVHRAKGLEAERVFILHEELMPHPKAKLDWEKVQEDNILYVSLTRSKNKLYFVKNET
jgi:DNA helicase-2/ATP-dependent DNA helicase PcrA